MTIPQYPFPPFAVTEGNGASWTANRDHSISVLPLSLFGVVNGDDGAQISAAAAKLANGPSQGGRVLLGPYDYNILSTIQLPAGAQTPTLPEAPGPVSLEGVPNLTTLNVAASAKTGLYCHRAVTYGGSFPPFFAAGTFGCPAIRGLVIDGTNAGANGVGADIGDGLHFAVDSLRIQNFSGTGAIGLWLANRLFYTEESWFTRIYVVNCSTGVKFDMITPNTDPSHDYSRYEFHLGMAAGHDGVVLDNTSNLGGTVLHIIGNVESSNSALSTAVLRIGTSSLVAASLNYSELTMRIETDEGHANKPASIVFGTVLSGNSSSQIYKCHGYINPSGCANPSLAGGEFSFSGPIADGPTSQSWPSTAFPGYGSIWENLGPDAVVCVTGAGVTGINLNSLATGLTSGAFFVRAGGAITVQGSGAAPTFNVLPAAWQQY